MISSLCFLPRGAAKEIPDQQELSAAEMDELAQKATGMSLDQLEATAQEDGENTPVATSSTAEAAMSDSDNEDASMDDDEKKDGSVAPMDDKEAQLLKELKMDGYDEEPEGAELMLGGNKLVVYENNAEDPYITVPDIEDDDPEDNEDLEIKPTDVVICAAKTEEEASTLEVYVYEEESGNLYVHHDFNLPSFPLALCWMDCDPRVSATGAATPASSEPARGSFLAVGTFQTGIEIWNLDVVDVLEPVATLGGRNEVDPAVVEAAKAAVAKKGKKGKSTISAAMKAKLQGELRPGSHADAVMCLGWHPQRRTILASGSADHTVKLWDISTQQCIKTFDTIHRNKVQSLQWNYFEPNVLLTGGYDPCVNMVDTRVDPSNVKQGLMTFPLQADVEQVKWSPHQPNLFAVSLENGQVLFYDIRNGASTAPLFTLAAHNQSCTNITFNMGLPTCFATASLDKTVKIWDFNPTPSLVSSKEVKKEIGQIYSCSFDSNYSHLLSFGGDKGKVGIWDLREDAKCREKYGEEVNGQIGGRSTTAATPSNPFAFPSTSTSTTTSSSSSTTAAPTGEKKKEKKKMKTSIRRKKEEDSD